MYKLLIVIMRIDKDCDIPVCSEIVEFNTKGDVQQAMDRLQLHNADATSNKELIGEDFRVKVIPLSLF